MGRFIGVLRNDMRVLVTGGSGFIGTNLVEHFASRGYEVCNFDIASPRNPVHLPYWVKGNLLEAKGLRALVRDFDPEVIFHMAARTDLGGRSIRDYERQILLALKISLLRLKRRLRCAA
jgi:nucleoside-diphosphate-sugar epimerase